MNGTTTITAQNQEGNEVLMWIKTEENQETLGMLIPGAIMMGIGTLTVIGSLGISQKPVAPMSEARVILPIQVTSLEPHPMLEIGLQNFPNNPRRLKIR